MTTKKKPGPRLKKDGTPARKAGRPKGAVSSIAKKYKSDKDRIESESRARVNITARQRDDCKQLAGAIKKARNQGDLSPADVQRLVSSTNILHNLEREAHDFGNKGQEANAVMVIPMPAAMMEQWQLLADAAMPRQAAPDGLRIVNNNVSLEEDIIGEPEPDELPGDPGEDSGPQAAGGSSA